MKKIFNINEKLYNEIINKGKVIGHNGTGRIINYNNKIYSEHLGYIIEVI